MAARHAHHDLRENQMSHVARAAVGVGAALLAALALLGALTAGVAHADEPFAVESVEAQALDATGAEETRAGVHPFSAYVDFHTSTFVDEDAGGGEYVHSVDQVVADLPQGFVGNPSSLPRCTLPDLAVRNCPVDSQVGTITLHEAFGSRFEETYGLYNMLTPDGTVADLALSYLGTPIHIQVSLQPDGYGLRARARGISQLVPQAGARIELWGVPGDDAHTPFRGPTYHCYGAPTDDWCAGAGSGGDVPAQSRPRPFLTNPTRCGVPLVTRVSASPWSDRTAFASASTTSSPLTGCDTLRFDPTMTVTPDSDRPDAPTGLGVRLNMAQTDDVGTPSTAHLRDVSVLFPEGMSVNPGSADGLVGCTDAQLGIGADGASTCPDRARIGTVTAKSPLIEETLSGGIFVREQASNDPESGDLFRIALVLESPERGISVRLPGQIKADARTGRLTAVFANNPQMPVSELNLQFKGGPRAPLASPPTCGPQTIEASLTSWSGASASNRSTFDVACTAGLGGFSPSFAAGTQQPVGGAFSAFSLSVTKPDGDAALTGVSVRFPEGLVAKIDGNLGTQVGTATAFAGSGSNPYPLPGKVFFEGRYGDAPYSLRVVVPAKAGPFDLGTVEVRQKVYVDPHDAHITVVSDPLPTIVGGVPVRMQRLDVNVDKPGFMLNPTSCSPKTISGTLSSVAGQSASVSSRFQVGSCASLPFAPSFAAASKGTLKFKQGAALKVHMAVPAGDANIKSVGLTLPSRLIPTINNACTLAQYEADFTKCPGDSFIGTVSAKTPILDQPLTGPAYIVAPPNDVPQVRLRLNGQGQGDGVFVELSGDVIVDRGDGRSVVTFKTVPDVPVTAFDLDLPAGPHSILDAPSDDLCKGPITADLTLIGQNGKRVDSQPRIAVSDCPKIRAAKLVSSRVTKAGVVVKVKPTHAGTLTLSGNGLKTVKKTVVRPNVTYTLSAKLSAAGKRAAASGKGLKVAPRVVYKPTNGPKALTTKVKGATVRAAR
jgi:hypothetical protein